MTDCGLDITMDRCNDVITQALIDEIALFG